MKDVSREKNEETDATELAVREIAGDIALGVQQKKKMYAVNFTR